MVSLALWSVLVRVGFRNGLLVPDLPALLVVGAELETGFVLKDWEDVASRQ